MRPVVVLAGPEHFRHPALDELDQREQTLGDLSAQGVSS